MNDCKFCNSKTVEQHYQANINAKALLKAASQKRTRTVGTIQQLMSNSDSTEQSETQSLVAKVLRKINAQS